jgi:hypothetical protein
MAYSAKVAKIYCQYYDIGYAKENATANLSSMRKRKFAASEKKNKSRSMSLGLFGLEAVKQSAGNTAKVTGSYAIPFMTTVHVATGVFSDTD